MTLEIGRVLVTGAAGFIGSHLTNALSNESLGPVIAVDDLRAGSWSGVSRAVTTVERDIGKLAKQEWRELADGCTHIFHLAAVKHNSPGSDSESVFETNIMATQRLAEAASETDSRLVFTSSLYAYGSMGPEPMSETDPLQPTTVYGVSKSAGEQLLLVAGRSNGLNYNIARLFFIYGPGQFADGGYKSVIVRNFERIGEGLPPVIVGDGSQALDYSYIDDCVAALIRLATTPHTSLTVNIASGTAVTISDLTTKMLRVSESRLKPIFAPPDWTEGSTRTGTIEHALKTLDWSADTSLHEGLKAVWDSLNE